MCVINIDFDVAAFKLFAARSFAAHSAACAMARCLSVCPVVCHFRVLHGNG